MIVKHYQVTEDAMNNMPFEEGSLYVTQDTNRIFLDPVGGGVRTLISSDLIILSSEEERENLLAPIEGKLYLVIEAGKAILYTYTAHYGGWKLIHDIPDLMTEGLNGCGFYKIEHDKYGHLTNIAPVTKDDITELGIPAQDTVYTHPVFDESIPGLGEPVNLYAIGYNKEGHIISATPITSSSIRDLGIIFSIDVYCTLSADGWSTESPYTQTVYVDNIMKKDNPIADLDLRDETIDVVSVIQAAGVIGRITTDNGSITAYCYTEKPPAIDIPIFLKVI